MIKKDYVFPYNISDGVCLGAIWENDILSITFFRYYTNDNSPNEIQIKFHGVEWIRSTTLKKYPCPDKEWDCWGYEPNKPIKEYFLIERTWFNNDYEEFMSGNGFGLNTICCLEDNVIFIDDLIIFSCNEIEIVKAICTKNIISAKKRFLKKYRRKYKRNK